MFYQLPCVDLKLVPWASHGAPGFSQHGRSPELDNSKRNTFHFRGTEWYVDWKAQSGQRGLCSIIGVWPALFITRTIHAPNPLRKLNLRGGCFCTAGACMVALVSLALRAKPQGRIARAKPYSNGKEVDNRAKPPSRFPKTELSLGILGCGWCAYRYAI